MKNCKSCKKDIDDNATKCPHCQAFQNWYRNPQIYGMLFSFVFLIPMFYVMGFFGQPKYEDHKGEIVVEQLSKTKVGHQDIINFKISNNGDVKWSEITYNVVGYDVDGVIVISKNDHEYRWLLSPHGSTILSAKIDDDEKIKKWELRIMELKKDRL